MKNKITIIAAIMACVLTMGLLGGCSGTGRTSTLSQEQIDNRAYMSEVNQTMAALDEKLDAFVDAVSRGDAVGMKTQADRALAEIAALDGLEVPEGLADVGESYKAGCAKMKEALLGYMELLNGSDVSSISAEALASVQASYNEGAAALQDADQKAAEKA